MDSYFIVAELELPAGTLEGWLQSPAPLPRGRRGPSVAALLDGAEGDVRANVAGDRLSLRAFLIDAAFPAVAQGLEAGFARAEKLGARGAWYAGDHVSGKVARLGGGVIDTTVAHLPKDIRRWVGEAGDLETRALAGEAVPRALLSRPVDEPTPPALEEPAPAKKPAPAKSTKASTKTTKAPAKSTKAPAKSTKAPAKATKAHAKATKAPAKATKAPAKPTKPPTKATKAPAKKGPAKKAPAKKAPAKKKSR